MLAESGRVNKYHKNLNKEHVYRMAKRLSLKNVLKYIVKNESGGLNSSLRSKPNSNMSLTSTHNRAIS